jgi:hypothetical protein
MDNHGIGKVIGSIYAGLPSFNWKAKYIDSIVSTESNPPTTFNSNGKFRISLTCPINDKVCIKSDGNNYFDFSDNAFSIQPPFVPVINGVSPESSAVSKKVMISSNNLPDKNVNVKFVGTKAYSGTSTMQYASPVEFEHVVKNVKVLDGSKIEFTVPSSVMKRSNSIRAVNSIVKVVPGYYQIIIETPTGSSKPFYFKVEDPRIVEASPIVVKAVGSRIEKSYSSTNNATSMNATSFEVDVYANRGDVYLGKSDSSWPAFSADNQSVELYKDGVLVNPKEYGLSVSYAQPVGTNYSSSDNSFVLLSGKSTKMTVYYKFYSKNPSASIYQLKLKNIMWSQDVSGRMAGTKMNKTTPVSASSLLSN